MKLRFIWDEEKNAANIKKHGVSFEDATKVFFDPKMIENYDENHSLFEERWIALGLSDPVVYLVVYTERLGVIRIISARKADKKEEEDYFYG